MDNYTAKKSLIVAIPILTLLAIPVLLSAYAFADNPYIGGYRDSSTIDQFHQFTGWANLAGSTSVSKNTGPVVSTSGWTGSAPTAYMYQAPIALHPSTNTVTGEPQVWGPVSKVWSRSVSLGHHGTAPSDLASTYFTFYWLGASGSRTGVSFYYEPHFNDGTATSAPIQTYTKVTGDTSNNFASGWQTKTVGSTNYKVKFLQFGVESECIGTGCSSSGWMTKQYNMMYYTSSGSVSLASIVARSMEYNDVTYGTWINWDTSAIYSVGKDKYIANADYDLKPGSTLSPGEVKWYKDPTTLTKGTRLW